MFESLKEEISEKIISAERATSKGDYKLAIEIYSKALQLAKSDSSAFMKTIIKLNDEIGSTFEKQGMFNQAVETLTEALHLAEEYYGENHVEVGKILNNLGSSYSLKGSADDGIKQHLRAIEIFNKQETPPRLDIATSYNRLGNAYANNKMFSESLRYYIDALDIRRELLGDESIDVANTLNNLGTYYESILDFNEAKSFYVRALETLIKLLGKDHPEVGDGYFNLAHVYYKTRDYDKAIEYALEAKRVYFQLGNDNLRYNQTIGDLGSYYVMKTDYLNGLKYGLTSVYNWYFNFAFSSGIMIRGMHRLAFLHHKIGASEYSLSYLKKNILSSKKTIEHIGTSMNSIAIFVEKQTMMNSHKIFQDESIL